MFDLFVYVFAVVSVLWFAGQCPDDPIAREPELLEVLDSLDLLWIGNDEPQAIDWELKASQTRALCQLYGIACSKRGQISSATLAQLHAA